MTQAPPSPAPERRRSPSPAPCGRRRGRRVCAAAPPPSGLHELCAVGRACVKRPPSSSATGAGSALTLMSPPKERERACFLLGAGRCSSVPALVCLTNCIRGNNWRVEAGSQGCRSAWRRAGTHLAHQLLLLGRVGHAVADVPEELPQSLLRVLLSRGALLLPGAGPRNRRPLQRQRPAPGGRAARRQQLRLTLGGGRARDTDASQSSSSF